MADLRTFTVDHVQRACRFLPPSGWQRVVADHPSSRPAATLLPVVDLDGIASLVVTRRTESLSHGGDWVFPGGALADATEGHASAARRETAEELGIDPDRIRGPGHALWGLQANMLDELLTHLIAHRG